MLKLKIFTIRNLFIITVVLYLLIVLLPYAFVTHDGPSHLYNAHIINKLLFPDGSIYEKYHALNPNWVQPNLVGYLILCFLQLIAPFLWAEKILIAFYVLLFSFGFRFFMKQVSADPDWYSLLIFPFILNAILFWGFYNFLIGLALSFWFVGLYEKFRLKFGYVHIFQLILLSLLVYFSHALVFLFCGLYVFMRIFHETLVQRKFSVKTLKSSLSQGLIFVPGIILFINFILQQKNNQLLYENGFHLFNRLSLLWFRIDSLSFTGYSEGSYLKMLYVILMFLSVLKFHQILKKKEPVFSPSFIILGVYFLIYLFLPDSAVGGGIIMIRLNLVFFLFWILWLSDQPLTKLKRYMIIAFYLVSLPLLVQRWNVIESTARHCKYILDETEKTIPAHSTLSTVYIKPISCFIGNYKIHSYIDLMSKLDNYVAVKCKAMTFHNYEASNNTVASYFPVIWKNRNNSEVIWKQIDADHKLEYYELGKFEEIWNQKPGILLCIGPFEIIDKFKPVWDAQNDYSLVKSDSAKFLKIYSLQSTRNQR
jgi:hypothetical protein